MKKSKISVSVLILLLTLLLTFNCSVVTVFADNSDDSAKFTNIYDSSEIDEVMEAIKNDGLISDFENTSTEEVSPYKLYSVTQEEFSGINKNAAESIIASGDYQWIVPNSSGKVIKVAKEQGKWKVLGYSTSENNTKNPEASLGEFVNDILKTGLESAQADNTEKLDGDDLTENAVCFEVPQYYTYFIGLFSENGGYVIPYGSRSDLTGLENGKMYSVENADKILRANFNISESDYDNGNGGGAATVTKTRSIKFVISIPAVILIVVAIVFFAKKKRATDY